MNFIDSIMNSYFNSYQQKSTERKTRKKQRNDRKTDSTIECYIRQSKCYLSKIHLLDLFFSITGGMSLKCWIINALNLILVHGPVLMIARCAIDCDIRADRKIFKNNLDNYNINIPLDIHRRPSISHFIRCCGQAVKAHMSPSSQTEWATSSAVCHFPSKSWTHELFIETE